MIRAREISPSWVLLYAVTFALQLFCAAVRGALVYPVLWLLFTILGQPTTIVHTLALAIAYGPPVLSLLTLLLPVGGWLWMQQEGGRLPSSRERLVYEDALEVLRQVSPGLRPPRRWFVVDDTALNAAAYADTLMLTRGLLESGFTEAVLAHELGHLNSSDGRLTAALHRLTTPPRHRLRFSLRVITFIPSGALAVWVTRAPWAAYWRGREFQADLYAADLGQAAGLARFLDTHALQYDLPVPFMWLTEQSHPYVEHRIDYLYEQEDPT